jgi:tetratricopeptide (TPR) repeat protein
VNYRAAVLTGFLTFAAVPALAAQLSVEPAPDGDPKVVAATVISLTFDPPYCPSVARASRLDDGSIKAACSNGEIFWIFSIRNKPLALRCSIAESVGVACSGEPRTSTPVAAPAPASTPTTPSTTPSAYMSGLAALDRGDFDVAVAEFTTAITNDPKDTFSYIRRATAYEKKGDTALAIADYRKLLKLVDDDTGAEYAAKIRKLEKTKK